MTKIFRYLHDKFNIEINSNKTISTAKDQFDVHFATRSVFILNEKIFEYLDNEWVAVTWKNTKFLYWLVNFILNYHNSSLFPCPPRAFPPWTHQPCYASSTVHFFIFCMELDCHLMYNDSQLCIVSTSKYPTDFGTHDFMNRVL